MTAYTIILTILVIAYIVYQVFRYFNGESHSATIAKQDKLILEMRIKHDDLLAEIIDLENINNSNTFPGGGTRINEPGE